MKYFQHFNCMNNVAVNVDALSFCYPDGTQALEDVSFSIELGDVFALLGPNGSGKSTTIHILTTLLKYKTGRVTILGYNCNIETKEIRKRLGVVFQRPSLDTELTIRENLYFYGILHKLPKKELLKRIDDILSIFGLEDKADMPARTLSGGLYRRVDLGRVFLTEPDILFLDEPTYAIDPAMKGQFHQFLQELCKEGELTILIATHDLLEAENLCNKIGFLNHGKLVTFATPEELKHSYSQSKIKITFAAPPILHESEIQMPFTIVSPTQWLYPIQKENDELHHLLNYCMLIGTVVKIDHIESTLEEVFLRLTEMSNNVD